MQWVIVIVKAGVDPPEEWRTVIHRKLQADMEKGQLGRLVFVECQI